MDFHSQAWKDAVLGNTFILGSPEDRLLQEALHRLELALPLGEARPLVTEILTVALWNAQKILHDRAFGNKL